MQQRIEYSKKETEAGYTTNDLSVHAVHVPNTINSVAGLKIIMKFALQAINQVL